MNKHDTMYLNTVNELLDNGRDSTDRTGTGTIKVPGMNMRFNMADDFPLLTSKYVPFRIVEREKRMFLNGITDNKFLTEEGINIWTPFANEKGELGPIYGAMWRRWPEMYGDGTSDEIDQIANLMTGLKNNPMSRRHVVTGWNPAVLPIEGRSHAENVNGGYQALPPCHTMWQVHCVELTVLEREALHKEINGSILLGSDSESFRHQVLDRIGIAKYGVSLQLFQRSADMFLGVPFNIASYSLLLHYIAHSLNMKPMEFIWNGGDCHIYKNHIAQVKEQIGRLGQAPRSPTLRIIGDSTDLWNYNNTNIDLDGYDPMPAIKGAMSV
jgi:thymidylate synthase